MSGFASGCIAGYERNGINCDICPVNTKNPNDDNSTACTSCGGHRTTAGANGQSACLGEQLWFLSLSEDFSTHSSC